MKLDKYMQAKIRLLFYSSKYDWVKKQVEQNDIDLSFGLSNNCTTSEIEEYINIVKEENNNKAILQTIDNLKEDMKNTNCSEQKVIIGQQIMKLNSIMESRK